MILKCPRYDFGGGRRSAIDQDHQRLAVGDIAMLCPGEIGIASASAFCDHNGAATEQSVGNRNSLLEQATRIITKIDDIAGKTRPKCLFYAVDRVLQGLGCMLIFKCFDFDPADVAFNAVSDGGDPDDAADRR